jgi:alpha-glucosidase (family GH31 glycosyl hydrolase)
LSNRLACLVLAAIPAAWAAEPPGVTTLGLEDGQVSLAWISTSSFRFCRAWDQQKCAPRTVAVDDEVKVTRQDTPSHIRLHTEYVVVEVDKRDGRVRVSDKDNKELMAETAPMRREGAAISVERAVAPEEAFYGLGARTDARVDGREQIIESSRPFLISSRGYGLVHESPGNYVFDLAFTKADRYRVTVSPSQRFEYCFYYGPSPKSILEEHKLVRLPRGVQDFSVLRRTSIPGFATFLPSPQAGSWGALAGSTHALVHASLSAILNPVFDLAPYRDAPDMLFRRAVQLASISPLVADTSGEPLDEGRRKLRDSLLQLRRRLAPFLLAYADETSYKGYPMIHPLPLQYPNDTEGGKLADEFMVGDEILAAPVCTEANRRTVYFPMGNWTELRTNKVYPGRQRAEVEAPPDEIPLFVRNGSIVPLESEQAGGPMELHYMPKLAAEFFLYEPDLAEYSQAHAAPALDLMRLEIESKPARTYEWIAHHLPHAREIKTGETVLAEVKDPKSLCPGTWYYDQDRQNIHIVVQVPAGETRVTHIAF